MLPTHLINCMSKTFCLVLPLIQSLSFKCPLASMCQDVQMTLTSISRVRAAAGQTPIAFQKKKTRLHQVRLFLVVCFSTF